MLPHCQFSVSDYKSYFQLLTIHRIQKTINIFHRYLYLVLLKPFFFIDLCKHLLWRSTHKCNWGKGEKITYLVYFNSLGENNSPPANILLQNVDLNCSSEKKNKSHSSVKNEVTEIWVKASYAERTKASQEDGRSYGRNVAVNQGHMRRSREVVWAWIDWTRKKYKPETRKITRKPIILRIKVQKVVHRTRTQH